MEELIERWKLIGWLAGSIANLQTKTGDPISEQEVSTLGSVESRDRPEESANTGSHQGAARVTMESVEDHRWVKIHWSGEEWFKCEQSQDGGLVEDIIQSL